MEDREADEFEVGSGAGRNDIIDCLLLPTTYLVPFPIIVLVCAPPVRDEA